MHVDRCTKALLLLIGLGLWAVAFAHFLSPSPAVAQGGPVPVNIESIGAYRVTGGTLPVEVRGVEGSVMQLWPIEVKVVR